MAIPVTLDDAKRQLRQGGETLDDEREAEIESFIARAAAWVERYTGQILVARDVTEQFAGFGRMDLRAWPVKPTAAVAVTYEDRAGAAIALTGSRVSVAQRPARVLPAFSTRWPPVGDGTVTVTLRAGYEGGDAIPGDMVSAMLVLIGAYDADREGGEVLQGAERVARDLCGDFRLRRV